MILMKICCILFGMASWIACVGVWVELPLLVNVMPEVRANREVEFGSNWGETGMKLRSDWVKLRSRRIFYFRPGPWHRKCHLFFNQQT